MQARTNPCDSAVAREAVEANSAKFKDGNTRRYSIPKAESEIQKDCAPEHSLQLNATFRCDGR